MTKRFFVALMFSLSGIKLAFAAPVLITLPEYNALSGSGVETVEDFESFTPFNTHDSSQLQLSNGMFNGSDPNFPGGPSIREESNGNQFLVDNGSDEPQTFNLFPTNTTIWAVDIRWLFPPAPFAKFRLDATSNSGSSTFFVGGNDCGFIGECEPIDPDIGFVGLYDPDGLTSVAWQQFPGTDPFSLSNTWIPYAYDNVRTVSAVPLPAAFWLFGSGLLGLVGIARRGKKVA